MAVVFMDGFDSYNGTTAPNGTLGRWAVGTTAAGVGTGRFGGQALLCASGSNSSLTSPSFTSVSSLTLGFSYQRGTNSNNTRPISLYSGATEQVGFAFNTDGSITASRAGTALGTTAAGLTVTNVWYTVEIEVVISDTVGRITIYLDGVQVLNLTGQDTRNGAPTDVTNIRLGSHIGTTSQTFIDDLYITDSATKPTNALRIETLVPNADGATLNFTLSTGTSHFAVVDELPANTTDYASGSAVGDLDELDLTNLSATPTAIEAVQVGAVWLKTDATARQMALEVKSGATTSTGSNYVLTTTGDKATRLLTTDPDTGAAWTASAVNALKTRTKVTV